MDAARLDLDGKPIKAMTICMIGAGGFIGSHLCEKLMAETPHTVLAVDVYNDKIKHLLGPDDGQESNQHAWAGRIHFHRLNIKHDSRLEGLIKMSDLVRLSDLSPLSIPKCALPFRDVILSLVLLGSADYQSSGDLHSGGLQHPPPRHHLQQFHRCPACGMHPLPIRRLTHPCLLPLLDLMYLILNN